MNLEETLCRSFCGGLEVSQGPDGIYCVDTVFEDASGDRLTFYVTVDENRRRYRIEDSGSLVPTMIATGTNILAGNRKAQFNRILADSNVIYDEASGELRTDWLSERELASAAFRFIDAVLKIHAVRGVIRPEAIANTFRDDATSAIAERFKAVAEIDQTGVVDAAVADFVADLVLRRNGVAPVAVFFGVSEERLWEAIALKLAAKYQAKVPCSVVALIEGTGTRLVSQKSIARTSNRVDALAWFNDDPASALNRIGWELGIDGIQAH